MKVPSWSQNELSLIVCNSTAYIYIYIYICMMVVGNMNFLSVIHNHGFYQVQGTSRKER
jgi:hypothetical protein